MDIYSRLCQEFTTEDQVLFVNNFYLFLNHDPDRDYVVDIEKAMNFIGFTRKDHIKRLLNRITDSSKVLIQKHATELTTRGGSNKETILLTVNAFKELCLLANTEQAKRIRQYYIRMEAMFMQYLKKELENVTDKVKYLEAELEKASKKRKKTKYTLGDTVYIVWDRADNVYKVGSTDNMNARQDPYHTSSNNCYIVYTRRCGNKKLVESAVHHRLAQYMYNNRHDWFQTDFNIIRKAIDDIQTTIDGEPMEYSLDLPENMEENLCETPEQNTPQEDLPEVIIKPVMNFWLFFEECFNRKEDAKTPWIDITARYRLWSRRIQHVHDELSEYMHSQGFTECFMYDPLTMANVKAWSGLEMLPLEPLLASPTSSRIENFLADTCCTITTGRVTVFELYPEFLKWLQSHDPNYGDHLKREDKKQLRSYCNRKFVGAVVNDGQRGRFGYYGVALKGREHVGRKFKNNNRKKVCQVEAHSGEVKKQFASLTHAANYIGVSIAQMSNMISLKTVHEGFRYMFVVRNI